MFGAAMQAWGRRMADRVMGPLSRTAVTPNTLTVLGLVLNLLTAMILAQGWLFAGGVGLLVAGVFDMFDGALARVKGAGSTFGAFFDSTLDRLAEAVVLLGLAWHFMNSSGAERVGAATLAYLTIIGSLMISYARARAEGLGLECKVGLVARPERVIILALGLLLTPPFGPSAVIAALIALTVSTFGTVAQRIYHVWKATLPAVEAPATSGIGAGRPRVQQPAPAQPESGVGKKRAVSP